MILSKLKHKIKLQDLLFLFKEQKQKMQAVFKVMKKSQGH